MANPIIAPYGSWRSPITSDMIVAGTVGLSQALLDGDDCYWVEGRPLEGGRYVIVRRSGDGTIADLTPAGFNVRTRVHEYGGAAYIVDQGTIYFSNYTDQRLYRQRPGEAPLPISPPLALRYADAIVDRVHGRLIHVLEDHTDQAREAINSIAAIALDGGEPILLVSGHDFYAAPRLSPDGNWLAWMAWNHPHMPWDAAELWVAPVGADGMPGTPEQIAGGAGDSVFQPEWSPDGTLFFVAERSGWWNLYRWKDGEVEAIYPMEAEFGQPLWNFRANSYGFLDANRILCSFYERGVARQGIIDIPSRSLAILDTPYDFVRNLVAQNGAGLFIGGSPTEATAVVRLELDVPSAGQYRLEVLRRASERTIDQGYLSVPETIEFPTENGLTAFGFFYPPANRDYTAPAGEKPPLLVMSHGGPTGAAAAALDLEIQYWTSRGIAVLDVNYGGSTGYGRAYRERLDDRWGIVDVDDCCNGARYLAARGSVDGGRLAITGGSAGGYTTLCALTFRDVFKAGASHFGVADLEGLARDTHKFESRYLDRLIGPYPERRDIYHERSPIHNVGRLECPVIFFQGLEDKVVPPSQAEAMVAALRTKGMPVAYIAFEGEQHGFRKAENIKRALDGELYFYARVFDFALADAVEPVAIENL